MRSHCCSILSGNSRGINEYHIFLQIIIFEFALPKSFRLEMGPGISSTKLILHPTPIHPHSSDEETEAEMLNNQRHTSGKFKDYQGQ